MKVFVAAFSHESNTFNRFLTTKNQFQTALREECRTLLPGAAEVFETVGMEVIYSRFISAMPSGVIEEDTFRALCDDIFEDARAAGGVDGVFLHLHGAIYVDNIGCGELYILRHLRKIFGEDIPFAVGMDPHGNISPDMMRYADIVRAYHTAPHIDQQETFAVAARALLLLMQRQMRLEPVFYRLPMLLCGDMALTSMKPLSDIIPRLKRMEAEGEALCASFFISMHSANTENTYPCVVLVPGDMCDREALFKIAKSIAHEIYDRRYEFCFEGEAVSPEKSVEIALNCRESQISISDSGDNTTAGGSGMNTLMLRAFLEQKDVRRRVLISTLLDPKACAELLKHDIDDTVCLQIGTGLVQGAEPVLVKGVVVAKGCVLPHNAKTDVVSLGHAVTLRSGMLDVEVVDYVDSLCTDLQFKAAGLDPKAYDIHVVKQAYQFPDIVKRSRRRIIALTPGATYQELHKLYYSKLPWTLWPFRE